MELIFIRHAQPEWVRDGVNLIDPPLTELGRTQAALLAEHARTFERPTALVVSPTRRSRQTAEPLAAALGMEVTIAPWFEEIRLPASWEGAPAEIVERWFRESRHRRPEEWWDGIPGGETFHAFWARITENLTSYLAARGAVPAPEGAHSGVWNIRDADERIIFVGHGGSNSAAIGFLLGIAPVPWPWERFVSAHASVSRLRASSLLGGRIFGLRSMSEVGHLSGGLVTR